MSVKLTYRITIFVLLISIVSLPLAANSLSAAYNPSIYSAGYNSSNTQTNFYLQPGNTISVKYLFSFPEKSFDIYTGIGYLQLFDTRVTSLEFAKGFSSFFFDAGISYQLSQKLSLSGFMRMHNSQYNNTKTLFAHIEAGISPNIIFVSDPEGKNLQKTVKVTFPLTIDIRKDLLYAFSFGVGLEIELLLNRNKPIEEGSP